MRRTRPPTGPGHPGSAAAAGRGENTLTTALLLGTVVVAGLRPLIEETVDTAAQPLSTVLTDLAPTRPTVTLGLDLVILALCGVTLALRLAGRLPPRRSGLWAGTLVLAAAATASCAFASNRRLAISATLDWLTLPLLAVALVHLCRRPWHLRLGLVVILASGCANAVECLDQWLVMQPVWPDDVEPRASDGTR